ncbi:MAG TPA: hypothetical protein VGG48_03365 [Rhizomicrobium sp.]|jgi:hypothetical protein
MKKFLTVACALIIAALTASSASAQDKREGLLKVCKVAGPGIALNTPFQFSVTPSGGGTVPAGPAPAGYCWIMGSYAVGTPIVVTEQAVPGVIVTGITGTPTFSTVARTATLTIGSGVNEVTYTNERAKTGYLEICKFSTVPGSFTFSVNGATYTIPAMSCTPPIVATAGPTLVTETSTGSTGTSWTGCGVWVGVGPWAICTPTHVGNSQVVTVNASTNTAMQTLLLVINTHTPASREESDATQQMMKNLEVPK